MSSQKQNSYTHGNAKQHNQSFSCSLFNQLSIKSLAVLQKNLIFSDLQCKEAINTDITYCRNIHTHTHRVNYRIYYMHIF